MFCKWGGCAGHQQNAQTAGEKSQTICLCGPAGVPYAGPLQTIFFSRELAKTDAVTDARILTFTITATVFIMILLPAPSLALLLFLFLFSTDHHF